MKTDKDADRGDGLWSKLTAVTPSPQVTGTVLIALLLILSGVGPFAGFSGLVPTDHEGKASAQTSNELASGYGSKSGNVYRIDGTPSGGAVFIYGNSNANQKIIKIDENGNEVFNISPDVSSPEWIRYHTPTDKIYIRGDKGDAARYSSDGSLDWSTSIGGDYGTAFGIAPNGDMFLTESSSGTVARLNATDGSSMWTRSLASAYSAAYVQSEGRLYVSDGSTEYELDPSDGTTLNTVSNNNRHVLSSETGVFTSGFDGTFKGYDTDLNLVGDSGVDSSNRFAGSKGSSHAAVVSSSARIYRDNMTKVGEAGGSVQSVAFQKGTSKLTVLVGGEDGTITEYQFDETLGHPISGTISNNDGDPIEGATVSTGTGVSTTTDADGSYSLTVSETGTYDVTASARGYQDTTETVDVPDGGTTQNFSLTESDAPFVGSFNPNDGASLETSQVSLEAELRSHDGHDLNYTIYHRDTESADNFTALKTGQVADGTIVSTTVSDASGTNEWFVRLSDGTTTTDTEVFNYTAPGSLSFYDRETESLINDREITVEMRPAFGSWEGTTLTTTDGVVNFDDVDRDAGKVWAVFMNTTGYNSTFWTLSDVEHNHNVMLRPKGSNIETFNQTFALDDETGDYPPRTSTIELEQYYLGEYQRQDIDNFGQENRANLTVEPNTTYRIKVYNTNGNYRVLGEYNSSNSNRDGVITVHVNPIEEVPERFPEGNEDTTEDWENEDDYNSPPVADFSSNPLDPTIGESVSFDGSLSADFDGSISSYEWQFGDGTTETGASVSHSYGSAGTYTVELTVTDDAGLKATTSRTIYVAEDSSSTRLPPTAEFATSPAEPNVSEVVNLDASASTSDAGSIASVEWDLNGNGEFTESGTSIDHKFETSGFKRVCVRVTDDAGVSSSTCDTLVVFDDSPPGNASEGSFSGGGGGGGIGGGPVDDPTAGNPLLVGGVLAGVSLLIARRTGNLSKITGAASGLLRAGVSGVRRLVGVVRR
jgi:PKD repeat protein